MVDFKGCTAADIINDAKDNNHVTFLKKVAKPGKSFIELKRAYYEEFYPDLVPHAKKKEKFWEMIQKL